MRQMCIPVYNIRCSSRVGCMLVVLAVCLSWGVAMGQTALRQPTRADYGLQGTVLQVRVLTTGLEGYDMSYQEVLQFEGDRLARSVKSMMGREVETRYPLPTGLRRVEVKDESGLTVGTQEFDTASGRLEASERYVYDAQGTLAASVRYEYDSTASGAVMRRVLTAYEGGRLVRQEYFDAEDALLLREDRGYDACGNMVQRTQYDYTVGLYNKVVECRSYAYDACGNWVRCTVRVRRQQFYEGRRLLGLVRRRDEASRMAYYVERTVVYAD